MVSGMREDWRYGADEAGHAMIRRIGAALREACAPPNDGAERDDPFAALLRALDRAERAAPR